MPASLHKYTVGPSTVQRLSTLLGTLSTRYSPTSFCTGLAETMTMKTKKNETKRMAQGCCVLPFSGMLRAPSRSQAERRFYKSGQQEPQCLMGRHRFNLCPKMHQRVNILHYHPPCPATFDLEKGGGGSHPTPEISSEHTSDSRSHDHT